VADVLGPEDDAWLPWKHMWEPVTPSAFIDDDKCRQDKHSDDEEDEGGEE